MRVGAIDCGTNSIRLLIADASTETVNGRTVTRLNDVVRQMRIVRERIGHLVHEAPRFQAGCGRSNRRMRQVKHGWERASVR